VNDLRVGRVVKAVRVHARMTQDDVSDLAGVDRSVMTDLEHGRLEQVSLRTARRLCKPLEIELVVEARWRGGAVDRLVDRDHAAVVNHVIDVLTAAGWTVEAEFTFNEFGDRGSVDIVAWHAERRVIVIIEVKSVLTDLQAMLMSLSRKVRVVPGILEEQRGWRRRHLGRLLVVVGSTANRGVVTRHEALFATTFPVRSREVLAWIRRPDGDLAGLWFVSPVVVRHANPLRSQRVRRPRA
jgi:transcriptional regulator with XRE-family HTH domain